MSHGNKPEPPEVEQSKDVDLYLLDPKTMTFEEVTAVYEKITGRELITEEKDEARAFWEKMKTQEIDAEAK